MYCNEFTIIHLWMTLPWYTCYTSYACISSMISIPCSMKRTKMIKDAFWGAVQSLSKAPHIKAMWKSKCFGMHRMNRISAWPIVTPLLDVTRCSSMFVQKLSIIPSPWYMSWPWSYPVITKGQCDLCFSIFWIKTPHLSTLFQQFWSLE